MGGTIKHAYTGARYQDDPSGYVKVTAADGRVGLFRGDGSWVEGELREADPHMCGWISGPRVANHRVGEQKK